MRRQEILVAIRAPDRRSTLLIREHEQNVGLSRSHPLPRSPFMMSTATCVVPASQRLHPTPNDTRERMVRKTYPIEFNAVFMAMCLAVHSTPSSWDCTAATVALDRGMGFNEFFSYVFILELRYRWEVALGAAQSRDAPVSAPHELVSKGHRRIRASPLNRRKRALNMSSMTMQTASRWVSATPAKHFKMYGREGMCQL